LIEYCFFNKSAFFKNSLQSFVIFKNSGMNSNV
jgi:hypothetical protein